MKYSIRPACDADYQYCYRLTKRNMFDLFCRHWGGWASGEFRKSFNPDHISMVVMHGRRVGYLSVKRDDCGVYIENIQLSPFLHGRGIGTEILEQLLNRHCEEAIRLTTFSDNPARRLYERLGFIVTEREEATLRMARLPNKANAADAKSRAAD
ncbi:GNAT family N-acetyltransferase [Methylotuvimicrobium buryatense]